MPLDGTEAEIKALATGLKTATDEVRVFAEKYQTEMKNLGIARDETKADADKALLKMNELGIRLDGLEQKAARTGGGGVQTKTLGQAVIDSDSVKSLLVNKNGQARVTLEMKDITSAVATQGSGTSPSSSLVVADRQPIVSLLPERKLVIRDLLMPGTTTSNNIEYPVETDNPLVTNAAMVSESGLKPQSNIVFNLVSAPVRTIAHFMRASRQIMDDASQLQTYIDGRLRYGLAYVEEQQLLYGDGTGQNLTGIIPQAAAYSAAFQPSLPSPIDALRLSALQASLAYYPASGYVLHPTDWARIETTKDQFGRYIVGDPTGMIAPRLWGLPVVETQSIMQNHFLTGAFKLGAQIFDRMAVEVLISTENNDDFIRNMITIRCEERLALCVYRPAAFTYGALS